MKIEQAEIKFEAASCVEIEDGLDLKEASSVPGGSPSSGQGKIWVKDDAPNTLWFTDDDGDDHQLAAGASALSEYSRVTGYNGKGSTNTNIIRFTTEAASGGSDVTYTDSATDGGYWAISATGFYAVSVTVRGQSNNTGPYYLNVAAALSNTLDAAHIRAANHGVAVSGGGEMNVAWTGRVASGDEIWISTGATPVSATTLTTVSVTRVQ